MSRPLRIPYEEMVEVAHARGLSIEPEYATGLAYMHDGRRQYVAHMPAFSESTPVFDQLMAERSPDSPGLYDAIAERMATLFLTDAFLAHQVAKWASEAES